MQALLILCEQMRGRTGRRVSSLPIHKTNDAQTNRRFHRLHKSRYLTHQRERKEINLPHLNQEPRIAITISAIPYSPTRPLMRSILQLFTVAARRIKKIGERTPNYKEDQSFPAIFEPAKNSLV